MRNPLIAAIWTTWVLGAGIGMTGLLRLIRAGAARQN